MKIIDYEFKRGDTNPLNKFKIYDEEGNELQLTENDNIYFTIKTKDNEDEAIIKKSLNNGIELDEDNYYHIILKPEDSQDLIIEKGVKYLYDIELNLMINGELFVQTIIEGKIKFSKDVTREGDRE